MINFDFDFIINSIKTGKNFSFSRFGDGEIFAIQGKQGCNTDKHEYFPDMGRRLKEIITTPQSYFLGLQNLARRTNADNPEFDELISRNKYVKNDILHYASMEDRIRTEFFEACYQRRVVMVGNPSRS